MSSFEYIDMFNECQKNGGKYYMFVFDLVGSKQMDKETLIDAETKLRKIVRDLYSILHNIEKESNKKILLESELYKNEIWMSSEPFCFSDAACISIYANSIDSDTFYALFENLKEKYKFTYALHYAEGYFDTTYWAEGNNKFARSYCFSILSNIHKKEATKRITK